MTFIHTVQAIVRRCDIPKWGLYFLAFYMVLLFILFNNFYQQEYVKKSNAAKRKQIDKNKNIIQQNGRKIE